MKPEEYLKDFQEWPNHWSEVEEDIPYGRCLLSIFGEFVEFLSEAGLNTRTIRKHMDNLWLLGGEIIRDVNLYEEYEITPKQKLAGMVDSSGGPFCRHLISGNEINSFDATCRKLHKYMHMKKKDG